MGGEFRHGRAGKEARKGPPVHCRRWAGGTQWGCASGSRFCVVGFLVVAFVAYQLWGTALYADRGQSHLKGELARLFHGALPPDAAAFERGHPPSATHLPRLASSPAPSEATPPTTAPIGMLAIPAINVYFAVVQGVSETQLEQGPGHYPDTALPGEAGNAAIAGRRVTYAHPFYDLNALVAGDPIYVLTAQGLFRYSVVRTQVVAPTDVRVLDSSSDAATLTLTTCNPRYSAATRMVVTADFDPGPPARRGPPRSTAGSPFGPVRPADALAGTSQSFVPAVLWGIGAIAVALATWALWRRLSGRLRWLAVLVGAPLFAIALLGCYEHLSLALPASL